MVNYRYDRRTKVALTVLERTIEDSLPEVEATIKNVKGLMGPAKKLESLAKGAEQEGKKIIREMVDLAEEYEKILRKVAALGKNKVIEDGLRALPQVVRELKTNPWYKRSAGLPLSTISYDVYKKAGRWLKNREDTPEVKAMVDFLRGEYSNKNRAHRKFWDDLDKKTEPITRELSDVAYRNTMMVSYELEHEPDALFRLDVAAWNGYMDSIKSEATYFTSTNDGNIADTAKGILISLEEALDSGKAILDGIEEFISR
jgi:hypothetical protein